MKRNISIIISFALIFMLSLPVLASNQEIKVYVNEEELVTDQPPIIIHDFTLVPMRALFEALEATVEWNPMTKEVTASKDDTKISLFIDNSFATVNNVPVQLDVNPRIINGSTMVPLRFVSQALDSNVRWEPKTKSIYIASKANDAKDEVNSNKKVLTYEDAVTYAVNNNLKLAKADNSIEQAFLIRKRTSENLDYIPSDNHMAQNQGTVGLAQRDLMWRMSTKESELIEESITYEVKKMYLELLEIDSQIKSADLALDNAIKQKEKAEVLFSQGALSEHDLSTSKIEVEKEKENLQKLKATKNQKIKQFNLFLGIENSTEYQLEYNVAFESVQDINIDYHVTKVIENSTTVWLAEKQIDIASLELSLYNFYDMANVPNPIPYRAKQIDERQAELELSDVKKDLELMTRGLYATLLQLEDELNLLQINIDKLIHDYDKLEVNYSLGLVSAYDLLPLKLSIEQLELKKYELLIQHDLLRTALEKPWVYR